MSYAIVGILVVAFIAFVVLSAKAWHWSNIVFLTLSFLTGLGGLIAMSQVLDARRSQMLEVRKVEEDLAKVEQQIEMTVYGDGLDFEYGPESLRGLSESLNLELAGRGRVWTMGTMSVEGKNRLFKFPADRVQNPDNPAPASMQDMILFAFADATYENGETYPVGYVGSFKVLSETPNSVLLEPVNISIDGEYKAPSTTWTLYEKPPVDQRDAFIRDTEIVLAQDDQQINEKLTAYRQILVEQFIPAESFGFDLNDQQQALEYELIIDRIMFDGLPLTVIETWIAAQPDRISKRFDPPNEEIFVRYRFTEKSNRPYQVDTTGNIENDGQFTANGQTVDPSLHAGREIEFQKGDEILIDKLTADGYQRGDEPVSPFSSTEPVAEISRDFVRQLKDYPFLLQTLQRQSEIYESELARVKTNNQRSQAAIADAQLQEEQRDRIAEQLLADQQKFQQDVAVVSDYADATKLKRADVESEIKRLENEILDTYRRFKAAALVGRDSRASGVLPMEALPPPASQPLGFGSDLETIDLAPIQPPTPFSPAGDISAPIYGGQR